MTCWYPRCKATKVMRVPVPADFQPASQTPDTLAGSLTIQTGLACEEHVELVRRHLAERYTPRRMAYREGRP